MPELPEVETVCRGLAKALNGARIKTAEAHREDLRFPLPANLTSRLKGRKILSIHRRAKYILITLDKDETLLLHLGMSGRMVITYKPAPRGKHDHIVFQFDNGARHSRDRAAGAEEQSRLIYVIFNDPRRFGMCDLVATKDLPNHKLMRHLGIEPLGKELTPAFLEKIFKGKKTSLKAALLDQKHIVGIGNIYACEAMFYAGINPKKRAGALKKDQIARLVPAIRKVLNAAIKAGGSSLRDYVQADGELGYFQNHFAVYDREGKQCRNCVCDIKKTGGVQRIAQGGRSTFYCKTKQP